MNRNYYRCSVHFSGNIKSGNARLGTAQCGPVQYCVHEPKDEPTYFNAELKKKTNLSLQYVHYLICRQHANLCSTECIIEELKGKCTCRKNITLF
jgi:hypothetical protein